MNEHDTNIMLFALLTEAQGSLNRALSHYFRSKAAVHNKMFELHKQVAELANEYRQKVVGDRTEPAKPTPDNPRKMFFDIMEIVVPVVNGDALLASKLADTVVDDIGKRERGELDVAETWSKIANDCLACVTDTLTADECFWKIKEYLEGRISKEVL